MLMLANADEVENATWANIDQIRLDGYGVDMGRVLLAFVVDSIFYFLAAYYKSAVFPGRYGVGKPWYFFVTNDFLSRFWRWGSFTTKSVLELDAPMNSAAREGCKRLQRCRGSRHSYWLIEFSCRRRDH